MKKEIEMDEQSLTDVLKAILEHEQQAQKFMNSVEAQRKEDAVKIEKHVNHNEQLIGSFEKKYSNIRIDAPKPDLSGVIAVMDKGFENVKAAVDACPKPIQRNLQINLFPETNRREYYRMVFGRLFFWCFAFITLIYVYNLAIGGINAYSARHQNNEGNAHIKAWNRLYQIAGKKNQAIMSKTLDDAENDQ